MFLGTRGKLQFILIVFTFITLFAISPHPAFAAGGTISDQASCEDLGGTWEVTTFTTCKVTNLTINTGETLTIASTVHLDILGTVNNNGEVINNGDINHYGTINNNGIFTLNGTITNLPQMKTKNGSVFNNKAFGTLNVIDAIYSNDGTLNNNLDAFILIDSGQIANITVTRLGDVDSKISNQGTINIVNGGVINNDEWSSITNDNMINLTNGYIRNFLLSSFTNYGVIDSKSGYIYNDGTFNNHGTFHSYYLRTTRTFDNFGTLNNNHVMELWAAFTNQGILTNNHNSDLEIGGTLKNYNTLVNHWLITAKGTIDNFGLIENFEGFILDGSINNYFDGVLDNKLDGRLTNNGTLTNVWVLNNAGLFTNNSTLINQFAAYNTGELVNFGEIINDAIFDSTEGVINNECSGIISGDSEIDGEITDVCDRTPPIISYSISGVQGDNDWYTSDIVLSWTFYDDESSIISVSGCYQNLTINSDSDWKTYTCTVTSEGGTNSKSINLRRDATPPTASASISPAPNADGWHNTDVTVSFTGADSLSGLASCDTPVVLSSDGANQSASGQCADLAGNLSPLATANNINIDKTAPQVFVTGVLDAETYILGAVPDVGCDTQDSLSGVKVFASLTLSGGDENGFGSFTATCDGAFDYAGNSGMTNVTYTVITPAEATMDLIDQVEAIDGAGNNLSALLKAASHALEDMNQNNDTAAIQTITTFIDSVELQRGASLTDQEADSLIAAAQAILDALTVS